MTASQKEYVTALVAWRVEIERWYQAEIASALGGGVSAQDSGGNGPPPPPPPEPPQNDEPIG